MTAAALKDDYLSYPNALRKLLYLRAVFATPAPLVTVPIRASHFPVIIRYNCSTKKISNVQLGYICPAELPDYERKKEWTERNAQRGDSTANNRNLETQDDRIGRLDRREKEGPPLGFARPTVQPIWKCMKYRGMVCFRHSG